MSDFYYEWKNAIDNNQNDDFFILPFLSKAEETCSLFINELTREQFLLVFGVLQSIPTDHFLEYICTRNGLLDYDTTDIPQFSDFEKGAIIVPQILEFYPNGTTFTELGRKLISTKEDEANRKYGENHASLAALMSLASIITQRKKLVCPTKLGHFLIDYSLDEKRNTLKALLLRNPFIQAMIRIAILDYGTYGMLMRGLADSTAKRRRQSIRHLVEFILSGTSREETYRNIDWTV